MSTTNDEVLWLYKPEIDFEHFICHDCLERIGWKEEKPSDLSDLSDPSDKSVKSVKSDPSELSNLSDPSDPLATAESAGEAGSVSPENEKPADITPNAAGSSDNTSPAI